MNTRKLINHILRKTKKGTPLRKSEKRFNKLIGKTRFKVERTFIEIKRWYDLETVRYRGIEKMHTQNIMEVISYNLYRSPEMLAFNCQN